MADDEKSWNVISIYTVDDGIRDGVLVDLRSVGMEFRYPARPLFGLGRLVATRGALDALVAAGETPVPFLTRHVRGDWGSVPPEDARENEIGVRQGFRIVSSYTLTTGVRIWIITEADRSVTTLLLPEEY